MARTAALTLLFLLVTRAEPSRAEGAHYQSFVWFTQEFEPFFSGARTIVSNLNNPVGLSFGTPGFNGSERDPIRSLLIAEGGSQVGNPVSPPSDPIDIRARVLRVPRTVSQLVASSNRVDGGPDVRGSPEVEIVIEHFPIGSHIDRALLFWNTISVLGFTPVPGSDDLIVLSSTAAGTQELATRFAPSPAQRRGDFSVPLDWRVDFRAQARATGNAKTGAFAGSGSRFFYTSVANNQLMYYENGFVLDGERVYFDFGPEGPGPSEPGPGELAVRYPDAGMGLAVDPITGDLFYAVHGERGEIEAARVMRLRADDQDPSSPGNVAKTSRIDVVGATIQGAGRSSAHEFDLDGNLNGVRFTNIQSIRFGPDPRDPNGDPVLYVVEFAGFQDTSFSDVHFSNLYMLEIDRATNSVEKLLVAGGLLNPVEMLVDPDTGTLYLSLWGYVENLSGRSLPPGQAAGAVIALDRRLTVSNRRTLAAAR